MASIYIDTDTHFLPITWLDHVSSGEQRGGMALEIQNGRAVCLRDGGNVFSMPEDGWDLRKRLAVMDQHGFHIQVLIPENRPLIYEVDPDAGRALARAYNDATAAHLAQLGVDRDRFLGVAWVYLPDVTGAVAELDRAVRQLGMRAVKVLGDFGDVHLGSEILYPFYKKVAELDVPILAHGAARTTQAEPVNPVLVGADRFGADYGFLASALGFPFTYMLSMAHLIFSGTLDRFPTLKFGIFEAGVGWVPYLLNRLDIYYDHQLARPDQDSKAGELVRRPSEYIDRFYITVHTKESYLPDIVRLVPNHRFMLGSDFYHGDPNGLWPTALQDLLQMPGLPEDEKERILDTNPREFFGL